MYNVSKRAKDYRVVDRLWAPWRAQYVGAERAPGCIFCDKQTGDDAENLVVARGDLCFALLNTFPYNNGHVLVAPYEHTGELGALSAEQSAELFGLTRRVVAGLERVLTPHGFNIGLNVGRVAGAGIEDHLHIHIVPRWDGDTNFMPVLAETRVISQSLEQTYELLVATLRPE